MYLFLGDFAEKVHKNISLKHLEVQLIWQNHYLVADRATGPESSEGLEGVSQLVRLSRTISRRKSVQQELSQEIEEFFRRQQNKIKQIIEQGRQLGKKPKNKRHTLRILVQDVDPEFLAAGDRFGVVPFQKEPFLLREAFYQAVLRLLGLARAGPRSGLGFAQVTADVTRQIEGELELLVNYTLFPKDFILSNLLEMSLYSSLRPRGAVRPATSNFKVFKLLKYQRHEVLTRSLQDRLAGMSLTSKGTSLTVRHDDCHNHLVVHVRALDDKARVKVELVPEGFQFNVLGFGRSVIVVVNNEIIYNNCETFKQQFLNVQVGRA